MRVAPIPARFQSGVGALDLLWRHNPRNTCETPRLTRMPPSPDSRPFRLQNRQRWFVHSRRHLYRRSTPADLERVPPMQQSHPFHSASCRPEHFDIFDPLPEHRCRVSGTVFLQRPACLRLPPAAFRQPMLGNRTAKTPSVANEPQFKTCVSFNHSTPFGRAATQHWLPLET